MFPPPKKNKPGYGPGCPASSRRLRCTRAIVMLGAVVWRHIQNNACRSRGSRMLRHGWLPRLCTIFASFSAHLTSTSFSDVLRSLDAGKPPLLFAFVHSVSIKFLRALISKRSTPSNPCLHSSHRPSSNSSAAFRRAPLRYQAAIVLKRKMALFRAKISPWPSVPRISTTPRYLPPPVASPWFYCDVRFILLITRAVEPEPETSRRWSRSLKFGFRFHRDSLWGKEIYTNIIQCFFPFFGPNCSGAGTKKFRHRSWSLKFEYRLHIPAYYNKVLRVLCW